MSKIRTVNEPLRIRANLTNGDSSKFIRAFLMDASGAVLAPGTVDLVHIANGIYGDSNAVLMPNQAQVLVKFKVFDDAAFTQLNDCEYRQPTECYELSKFDPVSVTPTNQTIGVVISQQKITCQLSQPGQIYTTIRNQKITCALTQSNIHVQIKQNQTIVGVLND